MTSLDFLDSLAERLSELVENSQYYGQDGSLHTPTVFIGDLPQRQTEDEEEYPYPFVLIQPRGGRDDDELGRDGGSLTVWIIVGVYQEAARNRSDPDTGPIYKHRGWDGAMQLITRIRHGMLANRMLADRYELVMPLEWDFPEIQPEPQYGGWLVATYRIALPQNEWGLGAIFNGQYQEPDAGCREPVTGRIDTGERGDSGNG